jgi:enoyl-CoA hydratase
MPIVEIATHEDSVREIVLNAPEHRNALSLAMLGELNEALSGEIGQTRAVVISGAGKTFCAGGHLEELGGGEAADLALDEAIGDVCNRIRDIELPVIAAVEGGCVGAGVDLLLACDLRVAAESAFFQVPAGRFGLLYNPAGIQRMQRRLGSTALNRLLLLGEKLQAEDAFRLGIVSHLTPAGSAREGALELAATVKQAVPAAVSATKRYLLALEEGEGDPQEWQEERCKLLRSTERREAVEKVRKAVLQKNDV